MIYFSAIKNTGYINITPRILDYYTGSREFCEETKGADGNWAVIMLDICYSVGLFSLGLSPWAYIKFTKSFEENLWKKPIKRISESLGLEIQKSVKKKYDSKRAVNAAKYSRVSNTSTSGYSSAVTVTTLPAGRPSTGAPAGRNSTEKVPHGAGARPAGAARPGGRTSAGGRPAGGRHSAGTRPPRTSNNSTSANTTTVNTTASNDSSNGE